MSAFAGRNLGVYRLEVVLSHSLAENYFGCM